MKTFQQLQEEIRLVEASAKGVVFMFGRFNPPTLGHEKMVNRAIAVAKRAGIRDIRLYPSFTQDSKRNPLPHREKVKWLRKFFKGVKVIDDKDARTPFAVARKLSDEGMKRVIMIAGGDRVKEFQTQISKYIKHKDPDKSFEFDEFQVVSAGERDPDADNASGMSASKMRGFAASKDFGNFFKGMPSRAKESDASALFAALRKAMNLREGLMIARQVSSFTQQIMEFDTPDIAEEGKCYAVVWADGRGVAAYKHREDAVSFIESGDRNVVSVHYQDVARQSGRALRVRERYMPDRLTIDEEWSDRLDEAHYLSEANKFFPKWWYNSKTSKVVVVKTGLHIQQVVATPKAFGLTEKDVATVRPTGPKRDAKDVGIESRLKEIGWVDVTWSVRVKALTLRGRDTKVTQKALKWFINKIEAPESVDILLATTGGHDVTGLLGTQIDAFAKTGKFVKQTKIGSTMARFR